MRLPRQVRNLEKRYLDSECDSSVIHGLIIYHHGEVKRPNRKGEKMRILGNLLWILCGGLICSISWALLGCLYCITVIGIPVGLQCFKMASLSLNPFGKEVEDKGGVGSFLLNVIWFLAGGLEMALMNLFFGCLLCITIVGIPFGKQFFKLARLSLCPFGTTVERVHFA